MKFAALSEDAKQNAIYKYNDTNDSWWSDSVVGMMLEDGKPLGFDIDKVYFSGFWSQGDGASWIGSVDVVRFLDAHPNEDLRWGIVKLLVEEGVVEPQLSIRQADARYCHEYTMCTLGIGVHTYDAESVLSKDAGLLAGIPYATIYDAAGGDKTVDELTTWIFEEARSFAREIYRALEQEYNYQTSEEHFKETAEANDWDFDEEGNIR